MMSGNSAFGHRGMSSVQAWGGNSYGHVDRSIDYRDYVYT